jgi:hypothetical protein
MASSRIFYDFFSSGLPYSKRMETAQNGQLSILLVVLVGLLMFLRVRYPNASKGWELAGLIATVVAFFCICHGLAR